MVLSRALGCRHVGAKENELVGGRKQFGSCQKKKRSDGQTFAEKFEKCQLFFKNDPSPSLPKTAATLRIASNLAVTVEAPPSM